MRRDVLNAKGKIYRKRWRRAKLRLRQRQIELIALRLQNKHYTEISSYDSHLQTNLRLLTSCMNANWLNLNRPYKGVESLQ